MEIKLPEIKYFGYFQIILTKTVGGKDVEYVKCLFLEREEARAFVLDWNSFSHLPGHQWAQVRLGELPVTVGDPLPKNCGIHFRPSIKERSNQAWERQCQARMLAGDLRRALSA